MIPLIMKPKVLLLSLALSWMVLIRAADMPTTNACTSGLEARVIMRLCYNATFDLIRRGLSDDIASGHMRTAMTELVRYATVNAAKNATLVPLGSVCIPVERYSSIFTVRWSTVYSESEIDDMLMSISNAFYHVNGTKELPPLTPAQQADRMKCLTDLETQMSVPMASIDYSKVQLPATVTSAYDPKRTATCTEWQKYTSYPKRTQATVGARRHFKLCVDLIRMGCDTAGVWQLLRHYTALIHLGIRCERTQGKLLLVPDYFEHQYARAVVRLLYGAQVGKRLSSSVLPSIDNAFDAVFKFEYSHLATHGSWGQPDSYFGAGITIKNLMSYTAHAVQEQLSFTESVLQGSTHQYQLPISVRVPSCTSAENTNGNMQCEVSQGYCFFSLSSPMSWWENCCNQNVCENAIRLGTTHTTYESCCRDCNQYGCTPELSSQDSVTVPNNNEENDEFISTCSNGVHSSVPVYYAPLPVKFSRK